MLFVSAREMFHMCPRLTVWNAGNPGVGISVKEIERAGSQSGV
jgi:hypothetical protein